MKSERKPTCGGIALTGVTWLICLTIMIPFIWIIFLSFKTDSQILNDPFSLPSQLNLINYEHAFSVLPLASMYKNTLIIVVVTQLICLVFTFCSSYGLTRLWYKHGAIQNGLYLFILSGLMIPTYILLFPIYRMNILFGLVNTYLSVILPLAASSVSFNTLMFVGFLKDFPDEIEEAAIIDGCSLPRLMLSIVLPIVKPVITTVTVFNVLYVWNEFPLEITLIQKPAMRTISMGVSMFRGKYGVDYGGLMAGTMLILIPQLVFYGFFQKYVVGGLTAGAVKG